MLQVSPASQRSVLFLMGGMISPVVAILPGGKCAPLGFILPVSKHYRNRFGQYSTCSIRNRRRPMTSCRFYSVSLLRTGKFAARWKRSGKQQQEFSMITET